METRGCPLAQSEQRQLGGWIPTPSGPGGKHVSPVQNLRSADFSRDRDQQYNFAAAKQDILRHNRNTGELQAWVLDGHGTVLGIRTLSLRCGTADFHNDGYPDVLWHNRTTGEVSAWLLDGNGAFTCFQTPEWQCGSDCANEWKVVAIGDFHSSLVAGSVFPHDVLWQNINTGEISAGVLDDKETLPERCRSPGGVAMSQGGARKLSICRTRCLP